jgi:hypothetical protein
MSDVPKKLVVEIGGVARYVDFTPEEIQQQALDAIAYATEKAERDAEEAAKVAVKAAAQAKLAALGLTPEEIAAI